MRPIESGAHFQSPNRGPASRPHGVSSRSERYATLDLREAELRAELLTLAPGSPREMPLLFLDGIRSERQRLDELPATPDASPRHTSPLAQATDLRQSYREGQIDSNCPLHASNIATNGILRAEHENDRRVAAYRQEASGDEQLDGLQLEHWHNSQVRQLLEAGSGNLQELEHAQRLGLLNEVRAVQFNVRCLGTKLNPQRDRRVPERLSAEFIEDPHATDFDQKFGRALGETPNAVTRLMVTASPGVIPLDGSRPSPSSNHWLNLGWQGSDDEFAQGRGRWMELNSTGFHRGMQPEFLCEGGPDANGATLALKAHVVNTWSKRDSDPQKLMMQFMCCIPTN